MDEALYRLHAEREETYWWWVGKNRIILELVRRYGAGVGNRESGVGRRRALDIGCGAGALLTALSREPFGCDVVGVDMSPIAREYCKKRGFDVLDGMLPDKLPAEVARPESFDVIIMSEVIEHVPEDRASVQAVAKLLKPGGVMVCTVPAHMWLWSSHDDFNYHQRRYTREGFGKLFEGCGLTQRVLSYYQLASMPLVVGARVVEKAKIKLTGKPPQEPEVKPLPGLVNWTLTKAFQAERHVLGRMGGMGLPTGTSVISVHTKG